MTPCALLPHAWASLDGFLDPARARKKNLIESASGSSKAAGPSSRLLLSSFNITTFFLRNIFFETGQAGSHSLPARAVRVRDWHVYGGRQ